MQRILNCVHFGDCSTICRLDGKILDCEGCREFSKWKELKEKKEVKKMEEMKKCRNCGKEKSIEEFSKNVRCADGHDGQCRSCKSEYQKELRRRLAGKKQDSGNGRRRKHLEKPELRRPLAPPQTSEAIYLPVDAIKAIKKSVAIEIANDFQKFLEERYA